MSEALRLAREGAVWVLAAALVAAAIGAPLLAPYDPGLLAGPPFAPPSPTYLLGTNDVGQDLLSQLLYGVRTSLLVAGSVALLSTLLSWAVGLAAGVSRPAE
ncbi:MAG TPA: ABC transporter permease, partial [Chloroflexia bacterium]|nr:ABC transporter permease [Chloroflexia bacterium]